MKRILFVFMVGLLLSSCGGNAFDKTIAIYEDAIEDIQSVTGREELRLAERQLGADYAKLKKDCANEFAELELKAANGDEKVVEQLKKVKEVKLRYVDAKMKKRKELKKSSSVK